MALADIENRLGKWRNDRTQGVWISPCGHYVAQNDRTGKHSWSLWWCRTANAHMGKYRLVNEKYPTLSHIKWVLTQESPRPPRKR
jgi:hypothetical protein